MAVNNENLHHRINIMSGWVGFEDCIEIHVNLIFITVLIHQFGF